MVADHPGHIAGADQVTIWRAAGRREAELDVPEGTSLAELPALLGRLGGDDLYRPLAGQPPLGAFRVLVNGRDHFTLGGLDTVLVDGDLLMLMPFMLGG